MEWKNMAGVLHKALASLMPLCDNETAKAYEDELVSARAAMRLYAEMLHGV